MRRTRLRRSFTAAAAVLLSIVASAVIVPNAHADGPYSIRNRSNDWCLDSNFLGFVYINPCNSGNPYQRWERWNGGWTRNVATGLCLGHLHSNGAWIDVRTTVCADHPSQFWVSWQGGWYQRPSSSWSPTLACLAIRVSPDIGHPDPPDGRDLTAYECGNPNVDDPPRGWTVVPPI
jgi:hypothetical protein